MLERSLRQKRDPRAETGLVGRTLTRRDIYDYKIKSRTKCGGWRDEVNGAAVFGQN